MEDLLGDVGAGADQAIETAVTMLTTYGLSVIGAIVILIVGWTIAGWMAGTTKSGLKRTGKVDETLTSFLGSLVKYAVIAITVIAVLNQFGVETTSIVALLGATGLAIGLALQGTLSNVAAGVMLLFFRPFRVGDYVDAGGQAGTVKSITLFTTEMATPDNVQIIVPNADIWGTTITNFSHHPTRRVDIEVGIGYGDSIDAAMAALKAVVEAESRVLKEPETFYGVTALADSSVNIVVRAWVDAGDYWPVKFDLTKAFKEKLDSEGIEIPFPQTVVHMAKAD